MFLALIIPSCNPAPRLLSELPKVVLAPGAAGK